MPSVCVGLIWYLGYLISYLQCLLTSEYLPMSEQSNHWNLFHSQQHNPIFQKSGKNKNALSLFLLQFDETKNNWIVD